MPPARYRSLDLAEAPGLDGQMAKTLLDYKSGRHQQALKRLTLAKKDQGFDPHLRLIHQLDRMTEDKAPLLILELLFLLTTAEVPPDDTLTRYLATITCFHPDDAICHGAIYNSLILAALRRNEPALAERLCHQADAAYLRAGSDYLRGFVHLHLAFIRICQADPAGAAAAAQLAAQLYAPIPEAASERAMVEITALWVEAEATGTLPPLARLRALRETLASGEFWPETFVVFAGLLLRTAAQQDPAHALQFHSDLEAVLRLRGMTQVLPVMQLLREDHRRRSSGEPAASSDPPALPEEWVLLILPDAETVLTNYGRGLGLADTAFDRLATARDLAKGGLLLRAGRFDQAAPLILRAAAMIRDNGLGWLAQQSRPLFKDFCKEALARRRFVEPARSLRDTLLAQPADGAPDGARPQELTLAEFGIVQRMEGLTSNKLLARELGVTEAAVKFHLRNIYRKLGVHDRRAALQGATARGWIAPAHQGARGR